MVETKPLRKPISQKKQETVAEFDEQQLLLAIKDFEQKRKLSQEQQK